MDSTALNKQQPIIIVGSGIFGLSTSLHLARRGYQNVTVFDKQPYDESLYSYFKGADAASADMNKIVRSAYGAQTEYQELSAEAIAMWHEWNDELASGKVMPPGMSDRDRVFVPNGNISLSTAPTLPDWEQACIDGMEKAGHPDTQLATTDARHREIARKKGIESYMDPFQRESRGKLNVGVLDTTGGMTIADKACRMALYKARCLGVKFVFGPETGLFQHFLYADGALKGIRTRDGRSHRAALTVMACGGWTPVLVPQLDGLCEATAGSVALLKIPRSSSLWERLSPERFPTFTFDMRAGADGGLYGFPRTEDGWFKVGYRGTKYTNPLTQQDGKWRSTPVTRWSPAYRDGKEPVGSTVTCFPKQAHKVIETFLDEYLPELGKEGIKIGMTRLCWYTDSPDNHFIIDRVPGVSGLMVATGGSGHAFKYLPVIGNWVVDIIENIGLDRPAVKSWQWRTEHRGVPINNLMEGEKSARALGNIPSMEESELHQVKAVL